MSTQDLSGNDTNKTPNQRVNLQRIYFPANYAAALVHALVPQRVLQLLLGWWSHLLGTDGDISMRPWLPPMRAYSLSSHQFVAIGARKNEEHDAKTQVRL